MLRLSKIRPFRRLAFNVKEVASNGVPIAGLGLVGFGLFKALSFWHHDKYYGVSAVGKTVGDMVIDNEELEIKLDMPIQVFSTAFEMVNYYKTGESPMRSFDPPCEQDKTEDSQTIFRTSFFAKGPNDSYARRKFALIHAEAKETQKGVEIIAAVAKVCDIEELISKKSLRELCRPITLVYKEEKFPVHDEMSPESNKERGTELVNTKATKKLDPKDGKDSEKQSLHSENADHIEQSATQNEVVSNGVKVPSMPDLPGTTKLKVVEETPVSSSLEPNMSQSKNPETYEE